MTGGIPPDHNPGLALLRPAWPGLPQGPLWKGVWSVAVTAAVATGEKSTPQAVLLPLAVACGDSTSSIGGHEPPPRLDI